MKKEAECFEFDEYGVVAVQDTNLLEMVGAGAVSEFPPGGLLDIVCVGVNANCPNKSCYNRNCANDLCAGNLNTVCG